MHGIHSFFDRSTKEHIILAHTEYTETTDLFFLPLMTRITTNVLWDISLFHAETAEGAEIPFAMDKCTANLCVTLRPLREKNLFLCTSVKILCKSVISVCTRIICPSVLLSKNLCIPCILCATLPCGVRTQNIASLQKPCGRPNTLCVRLWRVATKNRANREWFTRFYCCN